MRYIKFTLKTKFCDDANFVFDIPVLDRPPSQMSFLEQFLKESSFRGSLESDEGDVEDNSSKSNISELSTVCGLSYMLLCTYYIG